MEERGRIKTKSLTDLVTKWMTILWQIRQEKKMGLRWEGARRNDEFISNYLRHFFIYFPKNLFNILIIHNIYGLPRWQ